MSNLNHSQHSALTSLLFWLFRRVLALAGRHKDRVHSSCLFRFDDPVSPHLAARRANESASIQVRLVAITTIYALNDTS